MYQNNLAYDEKNDRRKDKQYMIERIEISICFIFAYFGKNKLVDTNYNCLLEFHLMKNIEKKIKIMILKAVMKR